MLDCIVSFTKIDHSLLFSLIRGKMSTLVASLSLLSGRFRNRFTFLINFGHLRTKETVAIVKCFFGRAISAASTLGVLQTCEAW